MSTSAVVSARQRHNRLIGHRGPDDPAVDQARRELALAWTEERIREAVESAPPLPDETRRRIRELIAPLVGGDGDA